MKPVTLKLALVLSCDDELILMGTDLGSGAALSLRVDRRPHEQVLSEAPSNAAAFSARGLSATVAFTADAMGKA